jgi:hypothetical protein
VRRRCVPTILICYALPRLTATTGSVSLIPSRMRSSTSYTVTDTWRYWLGEDRLKRSIRFVARHAVLLSLVALVDVRAKLLLYELDDGLLCSAQADGDHWLCIPDTIKDEIFDSMTSATCGRRRRLRREALCADAASQLY